jgi:hypothetical protein
LVAIGLKLPVKRGGKARILPEGHHSPRRHCAFRPAQAEGLARYRRFTSFRSPEAHQALNRLRCRCRIDSNAPTEYTDLLESSEVRMERPFVIEIVSDVV